MGKESRRRCVACRNSSSKEELLRVVPGGADGLECDPEHSRPGRGAYVHLRPQCWRAAADSARWEHALKLERGSLPKEGFARFVEKLSVYLLPGADESAKKPVGSRDSGKPRLRLKARVDRSKL